MRAFHFAWLGLLTANLIVFSATEETILQDVRRTLDFTKQELAMSLLTFAVGVIGALLVAGPSCDKIGSRIVL